MTGDFWIDVAKLSVPIAGGLFSFWAKEYVTHRRERHDLMTLLFKDLSEQLDNSPSIIQTHSRVPEKLKVDGFCIFLPQMPDWYEPTIARLVQLDPTNAFCYLNFSARSNTLRESFLSLKGFLGAVVSSTEPTKAVLVRAVEKNTNGLNRSYLDYAEAALLLMKALQKSKSGLSSEAVNRAEDRIASAKRLLDSK